MRVIVLSLIVYLIIILQVVIIPILPLGAGGFNLPLIFLIGISLFRPKGEFIVWAVILGILVDALAIYSLNLAIFIFPAITLAGNYLLKKFWGKPGIVPFLILTVLFSLLYQLIIFSAKISLLPGEESFMALFTTNFNHYLWDSLQAILINGVLLVPLAYFMLLRLNQLFDYWDQKKRL
ncbi:MAG: hypothetical protein U9Q72_01490 [Patescibacteria group bacterium]|nr:hypothetical protein [Patescibacteria group bacterium]